MITNWSKSDFKHIAKYVLSVFPKIQDKTVREYCVEDLCHYFNNIIIKYETPYRKITKKDLIHLGIKSLSPTNPLFIRSNLFLKIDYL